MTLRTQIIAIPLILSLIGCGGNDDKYFYVAYTGTVVGENCFNSAAISKEVRYELFVCDTEPGSYIEAFDQDGNFWQGSVLDGGAFEIRFPGADERYRIIGSSTVQNPSFFEVTDSCVSFRCCTTLTGELTREALNQE